jgi:hypothetical protein
MRVRMLFPLLICVGAIGPVIANIDSGGGVMALDGGSNHSSIGAPFQTGDSVTGLIEILYPPAPALDSSEDADANGFPDSWEIEHFGEVGVDSSADADGDGTTNLMEYLAGTNPRNPASVFRPASSTSGGNLVLTVPTVLGRSYRVWGTENLQGPWTLHDTIPGDGSTVEWLYSLNQSRRYFLRVEILITPNN